MRCNDSIQHQLPEDKKKVKRIYNVCVCVCFYFLCKCKLIWPVNQQSSQSSMHTFMCIHKLNVNIVSIYMNWWSSFFFAFLQLWCNCIHVLSSYYVNNWVIQFDSSTNVSLWFAAVNDFGRFSNIQRDGSHVEKSYQCSNAKQQSTKRRKK